MTGEMRTLLEQAASRRQGRGSAADRGQQRFNLVDRAAVLRARHRAGRSVSAGLRRLHQGSARFRRRRSATSFRPMRCPKSRVRFGVFCGTTARSRSAARSRNARCVCGACRASWESRDGRSPTVSELAAGRRTDRRGSRGLRAGGRVGGLVRAGAVRRRTT